MIYVDFVTLGATGITVNKNGFGALPIQRVDTSAGVYLLKKAFQNGITFFDSARGYTDSESKIGLALSCVREKITIATKTNAVDVNAFCNDLEVSLNNLQTDYIDIFQFHNPAFCPRPGDASGLYDAMQDAKAKGKVRHIGITNHRIEIAREAAESGLYETIQYPISYLATEQEIEFVRLCAEKNISVIAMKGLSGGLITDAAAAYAFMMQFDNVIPIWGIQRESELDEFIACQNTTPSLDERAKRVIEKDRVELSGEFCRGCGYCLPCPAGIGIPLAARMTAFIKRASEKFYLGDSCREAMRYAADCTNCGQCTTKCPYGINAPKLIRESWEVFQKLI